MRIVYRTCNSCYSAKLSEAYHYIFECPILKSERNKKMFLQNLINENNIQKCHDLFIVSEYHIILRIAEFC